MLNVESPFVNDTIQNLLRRKWLFGSLSILFFGAGWFGFSFLPKTYQTSAVFNLYSDYDRIPMLSPFFSEIYDPSELRSEKESLLLQVADDSFLKSAFVQYVSTSGIQPGSSELLAMRKSLSITPLSKTSYEIAFKSQNPEGSKNVVESYLGSLKQRLKERRILRIQKLQNALMDEANATNKSLESVSHEISSQPTNSRIAQLRLEEQKLAAKYSSEHPALVDLRRRLASEERSLAQNATNSSSNDSLSLKDKKQIEVVGNSAGALLEKTQILSAALSMENKDEQAYFSVVYNPQIPANPISPKKNIYLATVLLVSLLCSLTLSILIDKFIMRPIHAG